MPDRTPSDGGPATEEEVAGAGETRHPSPGLTDRTVVPPPPDPARTFRIELDPPDGAVGSAIDHFIDSVTKFAMALSSEAARVELEERADGQRSPEVTGSMVIKANGKVRNPPVEEPPQPSVAAYVSQVLVVPTSLVSGVFGSYLNPLWSWNLAGVVGFGLVAVGCQVHAVVALRGRRRKK